MQQSLHKVALAPPVARKSSQFTPMKYLIYIQLQNFESCRGTMKKPCKNRD